MRMINTYIRNRIHKPICMYEEVDNQKYNNTEYKTNTYVLRINRLLVQ